MIFYHVVSDLPKRAGEPIVEMLVDGDIEVLDMVKVMNANI